MLSGTACPLLSARVVIRLSHRLHKGCNFFWSLSREKTGGKEGKKEENIAKQSDHVLKPWFKRIKSYHFFCNLLNYIRTIILINTISFFFYFKSREVYFTALGEELFTLIFIMRCRIFKYLYYLSYEQLLFKRKKQFFIVCFVMHIRRCRVEQDWSTRPRIQTETKKNLEPQQSRLLHMLIRGQILEDTL